MLERRLDVIILRAGFARTIMQARQMVTHGHFLLNGKKHNIPSYLVKAGDKIQLREKLKESPLYQDINAVNVPSYLKVSNDTKAIEVVDLPRVEEINVPADVLKVVEFYARA
jgi:small subunit ribosomal protein S4